MFSLLFQDFKTNHKWISKRCHWTFSEEQRSRRSLTPRRQSEAMRHLESLSFLKILKFQPRQFHTLKKIWKVWHSQIWTQALPLRPMSRQGSDMSRQCSEPHKIWIRFGIVFYFSTSFHIFSMMFLIFSSGVSWCWLFGKAESGRNDRRCRWTRWNSETTETTFAWEGHGRQGGFPGGRWQFSVTVLELFLKFKGLISC